MLSICAIIAARNEAQYLRVLLPFLASQGIDVVIIDNESTDSSRELYSEYRGNPVIRVEKLPWRGYYSVLEQLEAIQKLSAYLKHDWLVHHAPDEIMEHLNPSLKLHDAIREADENGDTVVNFDEFVFLPEPNIDYSDRNYYEGIRRYYFFEPYKHRLQRAWKRVSGLDNLLSGGHQLSGANFYMHPSNHVLRHYIVLSSDHAKRKYLNRVVDPRDLERGWHGNRLNISEKNLELPQRSKFLIQLGEQSPDFCKDVPSVKHYWQWGEGERE
jgi:glycosyltransferase involved in cell wall biosynthesis